MRNQLIQYVDLLFAGAPGAEDIKQEILQNTLDRYDDLLEQGKAPAAAYRLAISGIGDISEILDTQQPSASAYRTPVSAPVEEDDRKGKTLRAVAIAMYICCPIPLVALSQFGLDILGLCLLLLIVGAATALIIIANKNNKEDKEEDSKSEEDPLRSSIGDLIFWIGLAIYFALSFYTGAWYITWLMFPLMGAVKGLTNAILDLKEANKDEA